MEFFVENKRNLKNATLRVDNNFRFSEFDIIINDRYIEKEQKNKLLKDGKIKVEHFLKKGKNIITYDIKSNNNLKEIKFWIELE